MCNHAPDTCLWELCGIAEPPDVDSHCYAPMDRLLQRQTAIQRQLARRHLNGGQLVLYDITSVWLEGEYTDSELVTFGYNRDGKQDYKQIVVGLICTVQGCPVGVEVYAGNPKDDTTVIAKVHVIKADYGIERVGLKGDGGMLTQSNIEALKDEGDLQTISALTHGAMRRLLERKVIALDLFDERNIHEVTDPAHPTRRYCLCRNPQPATRRPRSASTRRASGWPELATNALAGIAAYRRATTVERDGPVQVIKQNWHRYVLMSVDAYERLGGSSESRVKPSAWDWLDKPAGGRAYPSRSRADIDAALERERDSWD
jgi:hypothetical protein